MLYRIDEMIQSIQHQGWYAGRHVIDQTLQRDLVEDMQMLQHEGRLRPAGVGRNTMHQLNREIRGDCIYWFDNQSTAQQNFLNHMETLRLAMNRELQLGLFHFACHYALFPPGTGYARHLDSFKGQRNRILSVVAYLNADWHANDGGQLVLYHPVYGQSVIRILPIASTFVAFLSEDIPHAVLPTLRERKSIAGWFHVNNS